MLTIPKSIIQEILRLSSEGRDAKAIAQKLDLNRMQVVAILAHDRMTETSRDSVSEPSSTVPVDVWAADASPEELVDTFEGEDLGQSGIYVGDQIGFEDVPVMWDPSDARNLQNPHLMIMGESGSGKTYAQQCLIAELANNSIPSLIFDYGQSFEHEKLESAFVRYFNPQEHLIGEQGLALNPLEIFDRDVRGPISVATRLADVFDAAFHLGDIQKKVLLDALILAYRNVGIIAEDESSWRNPPPTIVQLHAAIEELAGNKQNYAQYKNAAGLSARLTTFFMLVSFQSSKKAWSWDELISNPVSRVHILQFRGLEGKTQRVLVELLLWHFFFHFKAQGQNALRLFCVLDEAHHLSFRENGPLYALLREARKFGLGIIFASQQPEDFNPVAYGNTATKLIFQTADSSLKVSKFLAAKSSNYDKPEEIRDIISRLPQGNAFFITRNRGHVIRVANFAKRSTLWRDQ